MSEVEYWTINANPDQMTADKSVLVAGQGLFPSAVDNGIISMPDRGLAMVLDRLKAICQPQDGETQADADQRVRLTLLALPDPASAITAFGFTIEDDGAP